MIAIARRSFAPIALLIAVLTLVLTPVGAAAQEMDTTFYGYVNEDVTSVIMLGEAEFGMYGAAGAIVSPSMTEYFFDGFDIFDSPKITRSLNKQEVAIVSQADEYLVYEGDLDFHAGELPGYVVFISIDEKLFIVVGYRLDRDGIFDIVEAAIDEGRAPFMVGDYFRMELDS